MVILLSLSFWFLTKAQTSETMERDAKIYVAGHRGLVGQALIRRLNAQGFENIVTRASAELDLVVVTMSASRR